MSEPASDPSIRNLVDTLCTLNVQCLDDVIYYADNWPVILPGLKRIVHIKQRFLRAMMDIKNCVPQKTG